ncbi:hypothetical protein A9Q84_15200 [Halobacteriovorax marinus]|uniref:Sensory/regulatory protein RpfC n=1 Tax=Halobacteriovorax marinus TaxID=97084 RepID=A0A1Y5F996_9BACT|nr:hypothetical protein A9Q84_15200 [Halobacteriovorax marinus]
MKKRSIKHKFWQIIFLSLGSSLIVSAIFVFFHVKLENLQNKISTLKDHNGISTTLKLELVEAVSELGNFLYISEHLNLDVSKSRSSSILSKNETIQFLFSKLQNSSLEGGFRVDYSYTLENEFLINSIRKLFYIIISDFKGGRNLLAKKQFKDKLIYRTQTIYSWLDRNIDERNILIRKLENHKEEVRQQLYYTIMRYLILTILLFSFLIHRISKKVYSSIGKLTETISEIIETNNLDKRITLETNDEISILCDRFFNLIDKLKKHEESLCLAKEKAEEGTLAKSRFLSTMSHEIRTPLNGVLGMTTLLQGTKLTLEQKEMVSTINYSGSNLLALVNNILDYSKVESGHMGIDVTCFDLREMCNELKAIHLIETNKKEINFNVSVGSELPNMFTGDVGKIKQILINLLSNAIKFTTSGEVSFFVGCHVMECDAFQIVFQVRDTGVGIKKCQQESIFNPFVQEDNTTTRVFGGTGLGLSISNRLALVMGGRIDLESEEGEGSTFTFTLPLIRSDAEIGHHDKLSKRFEKLSSDYPHKILLVEDNKINQKILYMMLKKLGYQCDLVENGKESLNMMESAGINMYTLVLMDIQMPIMDGVTATKEIHKLYGSKRPKIIAITANAFVEDQERYMEAGMDDFISKPIDIDQLKEIIIRNSSSNSEKKSA